jgi:Tfp pilus assembly protein PilN
MRQPFAPFAGPAYSYPVIGDRTRLAILPLGDRLVVAAVRGARADAFVVEASEPASALRAELDARKLRARSVAVGLPRGAVVVKPVDLPEVAGEVAEMVRFELDRHLPFAADDAPFDFIPLPAERGVAGAPAARRVLVAAADRRVLDAALRIAQDAGLRPVSATVGAHDLLALVDPPRKRHVVWVHRVGGEADLLFLDGATLLLSRQVPVADEAAIVSELRRSFTVTGWRGCDAVWLSGDAAAPGAPMTSPLADLGVPVTTPPWTARAERLRAHLPEDGRGALELALAVAAGRRARPLDLIPAGLRPRRVTRPQLATAGTAALAAVLAAAALLVPGYRDLQRLDVVGAQITRLEPEVRAVEQIRGELERRKKLLETMETLEANSIRPLPVLRELTELVPNDAWLTLLTLDAKGVELTGQAAAASALIPLIENSPRLERAEFASPVTRGRDREQFRIHAKWESAAAAVAPVLAPAATRPGVRRTPAPDGGVRRPRAETTEDHERGARPLDLDDDEPRRPGATGVERRR